MNNSIKRIETDFSRQYGFDVMKTEFDKKVLERNLLLWQNYFYPALKSSELSLNDAQIRQLGSIVSLNAALKHKADAETDNDKSAKLGIMSDSLSKYYEACMRKFGANPNSTFSNPLEVVGFMQKMFGLGSDVINDDFEKVFGVRPKVRGLGSPTGAGSSTSGTSGDSRELYNKDTRRNRSERGADVRKWHDNNNPYFIGLPFFNN